MEGFLSAVRASPVDWKRRQWQSVPEDESGEPGAGRRDVGTRLGSGSHPVQLRLPNGALVPPRFFCFFFFFFFFPGGFNYFLSNSSSPKKTGCRTLFFSYGNPLGRVLVDLREVASKPSSQPLTFGVFFFLGNPFVRGLESP